MLVNALSVGVTCVLGRGVDNDWFHVLLPLPLIVRALVAHVACGSDGARLGAGLRSAFAAAVGVALVPSVIAAAYYSRLLIVSPDDGYEYVDNRALGRALTMIPCDNTLVVTNDLRYPANVLLPHQPPDADPGALRPPGVCGELRVRVHTPSPNSAWNCSRCCSPEKWDDAIERACRRHWLTHLLIRKDTFTRACASSMFREHALSVYRFPGEQ